MIWLILLVYIITDATLLLMPMMQLYTSHQMSPQNY